MLPSRQPLIAAPQPMPGVRCGRQAFTLVELLLVMSLLVIILSITAPTLGNFFRGRTLDSEARRLLSLTRYGQSRAVSEGIPMTLWLDSKDRDYGLEGEVGFNDLDTKQVLFTLDKDIDMEVILAPRSASRMLNSNRSKAENYRNLSGMNANRRNLPMIRFLPDGSIAEESPSRVQLMNREGERLFVGLSRYRLRYEIQGPTNLLYEVGP